MASTVQRESLAELHWRELHVGGWAGRIAQICKRGSKAGQHAGGSAAQATHMRLQILQTKYAAREGATAIQTALRYGTFGREGSGWKIKQVKNTNSMLHEWRAEGASGQGEEQCCRHASEPCSLPPQSRGGDQPHARLPRSPHVRHIKRGEVVQRSAHSRALQPCCLARPG